MKKVVLAYSGGLDTSAAIPWLREAGWEVVAVAVDVGQPGDLNEAIVRARTLGASEAHVIDARERFAEGYALPALRMNALYQNRYPLVSALSRPLIAEVLVDVARNTGATAVAHGCTGKGNDQVRFEVSLGALAPDIEVLAPVRDWGMSREQTIDYVKERDLPIETTKDSPYSIDENLWGRSIECGILEDPWSAPPEDIYKLTSEPSGVGGQELELSFDAGVPVAVDGESLSVTQAIAVVGKIAGANGFGRIDMVEDRLVGIKSREVYEAPAALALIVGHSDLENITLEARLASQKRHLEQTWTELVYQGLWFSPLRGALDEFARFSQRSVTGDVRLRFSGGSCAVVGRRSPVSLYDHGLATYDEGDRFDHGDAAGFVKLWGLSVKRWAKVHNE